MLTSFVSVARAIPFRPPMKVAVSVEFGRERTATPDKNATNLIYREVSNQQLIAIGAD